MAARFWVTGGTGNWSSTTNWSATTGGASGASVPGSADTATFDASSGAGTATVDSNITLLTLTMTNFTGTLAFGTNTISVTSTGNVFLGDSTFSVTGTPVINVTSTGSTAITVVTNVATEANSISFNFTGGTYSLTFLGASNASTRNVNFTGFAGTWIGGSVNRTIYGSLTLSTGMTVNSTTGILTFGATSGVQLITSNGKTYDGPIAVNGVGVTVRLADALTLGSNRTVTLTNGTLDLNNNLLTCGAFSGSNSNVRTLAFGTGSFTCLNNGTVWTTATTTNLSITGTPAATIGYTGASTVIVSPGSLNEASSVSFTFSGGTYPFTLSAGSVRNLIFSSGFGGSFTFGLSTRTIYGGLTLSSAMTIAAGTFTTTFAGTSGPYSIVSNSQTLDASIIFSGVGGTWQLSDNFTLGATRSVTHSNGTLNLNGNTLNAGASYVTSSGTKNLTFNGGTLTCPAASTTAFNNAAPTSFTTTAGTGTGKISMTAATAKTFVGGGSTFNCTLSNDGAGALTITGSNTFTTLANGVSPTTFSFTAGTTTTVTNWNVSGTAGNLVTIGSVTAASHTLSKASGTVSADYLSISYSTATGGAAWFAGANSTNGGNNSGWVFSNATTGNFFFFFVV
jgi:hypothetical protein